MSSVDSYASMHPKDRYARDWNRPVRGDYPPYRTPYKAQKGKTECYSCGQKNAGDIEGVTSTMTREVFDAGDDIQDLYIWFCHGGCAYAYKEGETV